MKKQRAKREYDIENGVLTMIQNDGREYRYTFNGLRSDVFMKLAMIGAGSILAKHERPMVVWEKICQNLFGQERNYARVSKTVKAYAKVENIPIEQAIKQHNGMNKTERKALRARKDVRKELLMMQIEEIV